MVRCDRTARHPTDYTLGTYTWYDNLPPAICSRSVLAYERILQSPFCYPTGRVRLVRICPFMPIIYAAILIYLKEFAGVFVFAIDNGVFSRMAVLGSPRAQVLWYIKQFDLCV
jgi:hypothetical protein